MSGIDWQSKYNALKKFIDGLEEHTEDFDDFCDCGAVGGNHEKDCMTMKIRKDLERALNGNNT